MNDKIQLLAGAYEVSSTPWGLFDDRIIDFLDALSKEIRRSLSTRSDAAAALGFWLRRSHIKELSAKHMAGYDCCRLGRGRILHIAPSNVPMMFAYSLAIGLLAGNSNIVRISNRRNIFEEELCEIIDMLLKKDEFKSLGDRIGIISYERDNEITKEILKNCEGRVIWGGDATIADIRSIHMPPQAVELCFPDRWSVAVISMKSLVTSPKANSNGPMYQAAGYLNEEKDNARIDRNRKDLGIQARRFYNDTYSMDQNACSSPQMVIWIDDIDSEDKYCLSENEKAGIRRAFWEEVASIAEKEYELSPYQAVRKYSRQGLAAMTDRNVTKAEYYKGNYTCVISLEKLPADPTVYRGGDGLFYEVTTGSISDILDSITPKVQTITAEGIDKNELAQLLAQHHTKGVDRIVPFGQALEMDTIWDGKDLIAELSRMIVG